MPERHTLSDGRPVSIGLCEDDHGLREVLRRSLTAEGYQVRATASGIEALTAFSADPPHLLVLDLALADADGGAVCSALRRRGLTLPVLVLTGRRAVPERLAAFSAGADDLLTKPFELPELLARMHGLLRRTPPPRVATGLRLDPAGQALLCDARRVPLTATELRLLAKLLGADRAVVPRPALAAAGWPDGSPPSANSLDSAVVRVRRKLQGVGSELTISTVRGVGYALR
jgi:two-component system OmpR family response regulator